MDAEDDIRSFDVRSPFSPFTPKDSVVSFEITPSTDPLVVNQIQSIDENETVASTTTKKTGEKQVPNKNMLASGLKSVESNPSKSYRGRMIPTKTMLTNALKSTIVISTPRKCITLQGIKNYMASEYDITKEQVKSRMPYVKRVLHEFLDTNQIKRKSGKGFVGSFYVPASSKLRKSKKSSRKVKKSTKKRNVKKVKPHRMKAAKPRRMKARK
ncbi:uncharacterized protein LOC142238761 [Haematobia irritans]|uniref:uncharacterized protein LOC142238761 n=1 Tax=Haematobia irritans TaxID=7368 RepID=UPI003F4F90F4